MGHLPLIQKGLVSILQQITKGSFDIRSSDTNHMIWDYGGGGEWLKRLKAFKAYLFDSDIHISYSSPFL